MNEEKKMNMQIISAKDYGEGRLTLESGRAAAYMMDDVLLAGTRTLTAKPSDWIITGTPQSSEAYGFMLRHGDTEFKQLVDGTLEQAMKGPEIQTMYDKWFMKPVPPKNRSSRMKRSRHERKLTVAACSSRKRRQVRIMTRWMMSAPTVQMPEVTAPVHSAESRPMVTTNSKITSEPDSRFCANCRNSS